MSRPCAVRKNKNNNAYDKEELVKIALERKLKDDSGYYYNVTGLRKLDKSALCVKLGLESVSVLKPPPQLLPNVKRECGPLKSLSNPYAYSKDELVDLLYRRVENKLTLTALRKKKKEELCAMIGLSQPSKSLLESQLEEKQVGRPTVSQIEEKRASENQTKLGKPCMSHTAEELRKIAKKYGLFSSGIKKLLCERIEKFLATGFREVRRQRRAPPEKKEGEEKKRGTFVRQISSEEPEVIVFPEIIEKDTVGEECIEPISKNLTLREDQKLPVRHLLDPNHRGLLVIRPTGLGKTLIAVAATNCMLKKYPELKVDWIGPVSVIRQYKKEFEKFGIAIDYKRVSFYSPQEYMRKNLTNTGDQCFKTFLIIDESHNLRNPIKLDEEGKLAKGGTALTILKCARRAFKVLLMTATPMYNRPSDLINQISVIDGINYINAENPKTFEEKIINDNKAFTNYFSCKISIYTVRDESKFPKVVMLPTEKFVMSPQYYKDYLAIQQQNEKRFIIVRPIPGSFSANFYQALRRASLALDTAESPKVQRAYELLVESHNEKRGIIAYTSWLESGLFKVKQKLEDNNIPLVVIHGQMSSLQRKKAVDKINNGEVFIVLITSAGGVGLDFRGIKKVILMENSWNSSTDDQVIGRAVRYGSLDMFPEDERYVEVHRFQMVKPKRLEKGDDMPRSVDQILEEISYVKKKPVIDDIMERLHTVSIENNPCKCDNICRPHPIKVRQTVEVPELVLPPSAFRPISPEERSLRELISPVREESPIIFEREQPVSSLISPEASPRASPKGQLVSSLISPESSPRTSPKGQLASSLISPESSPRASPKGQLASSLISPESSPRASPKGQLASSLISPETSPREEYFKKWEPKPDEYYYGIIPDNIDIDSLADIIVEGLKKYMDEASEHGIKINPVETLEDWTANDEINQYVDDDDEFERLVMDKLNS